MLSNSLLESDNYITKYKPFYKYRAYNLNINSDFYLPELSCGYDTAEVTIRRGRIESLPPEAAGCYCYYKANDYGIYLAWEGVGAFLVRNGCEMIVDPLPGIEDRIIRLFILGTSLAMLLHQRKNMIVLHASVVEISGKAVAFVGEKGAGKSTLAATLHRRGHNLIADDILAISDSNGIIEALPGFPHLKLWPDSVESLGFSPDSLPRIRPELEKRSYHLHTGFSQTPLPLKGVYVLGTGPKMIVETLQPQKALLALMPHWYGARFGIDFLQSLGLSCHFQQCAKLVDSTPIYQLIRSRSMHELPEVARLVEIHTSKTNTWV